MNTNQLPVRKYIVEYFPQNWVPVGWGKGNWMVILFLLPVLLAGCGRNKEAIVQSKVAERVQVFREKQLADCRTALRYDAEHRVDSLLLAEAKGSLEDSLARLRPFKPVLPPPVPPIDSLSVRPIFDPTQRPSGN